MFIYAANNYEEGKAQNFLRDTDIDKIMRTYSDFKPIEKYTAIVDLKQITENDYNLNVTRYVDVSEPEQKIDVKQAYAALENAEEKRDKTVNAELKKHMKELGYD